MTNEEMDHLWLPAAPSEGADCPPTSEREELRGRGEFAPSLVVHEILTRKFVVIPLLVTYTYKSDDCTVMYP